MAASKNPGDRINRFWAVTGTLVLVIVVIKWLIPAASRSITGLPFPLTVPGTLVFMYMMLTIVALFLFVTFSDENLEEFWRPIRRFLNDEFGKGPVVAVLVLLPLVIGWQTYEVLVPRIEAPLALRIQHPSSNFPKSYEALENPFANPSDSEVAEFIEQARSGSMPFIAQLQTDLAAWADFNPNKHPLSAIATPPIDSFLATLLTAGRAEEIDPEIARAALIEKNLFEGRALYAMNCRACHGDSVSGDGPMADGFKLRPINFTEQGTVETIVEGYTFWRVENGGPGLPTEATPWDSAMPEWKLSLTEAQRWKIIMAEYDLAEKTARIPETEG